MRRLNLLVIGMAVTLITGWVGAQDTKTPAKIDKPADKKRKKTLVQQALRLLPKRQTHRERQITITY